MVRSWGYASEIELETLRVKLLVMWWVGLLVKSWGCASKIELGTLRVTLWVKLLVMW